MPSADPHLHAFEALRPRLTGLAYRMTGSLAEAEDIVQDAWLRWHGADAGEVVSPPAFLMRIVARLCLDRARAAKARRETYVGPWLPEPVADLSGLGCAPPADEVAELADDLSVALLLVLERLSALERAAFLLHDVFDFGFTEIAAMLGRSPAACRQLASRARRRVRQERQAARPAPEVARAFAQRFTEALRSGDIHAFAGLLASEARLVSDGGGKAYAALRPILGRERILRFLMGLIRKFGPPVAIEPVALNGSEGLAMLEANGTFQTWTLEWNEAGQAAAIYVVRNPDKLALLRPAVEPRLRARGA